MTVNMLSFSHYVYDKLLQWINPKLTKCPNPQENGINPDEIGKYYRFTPCALIHWIYCRRFTLCWLKLFANR